jgi:hypothetical protein
MEYNPQYDAAAICRELGINTLVGEREIGAILTKVANDQFARGYDLGWKDGYGDAEEDYDYDAGSPLAWGAARKQLSRLYSFGYGQGWQEGFKEGQADCPGE